MNLDNLSLNELRKLNSRIEDAIRKKVNDEAKEKNNQLVNRFLSLTENNVYLKILSSQLGDAVIKLDKPKRDFIFKSFCDIEIDLNLYGKCYVYYPRTKRLESKDVLPFSFGESKVIPISKEEFEKIQEAYQPMIDFFTP